MAAMQFWGIEVKGKESYKVKLEEGHIIHLSQATLAELKKEGEPVTLYVKVGDKKLVLGILNPENNPQLSFDLVFDKEFEISHNSKNGSVHLLGYQSEMPDDEEFSDFSDEEEDIPIPQKENGKPAAPTPAVMKAAAKPNKDTKPKPEEKDEDDDDDSDDDEDDSEDEDGSDEDMLDMSGDESGDDEDDSEDDDEDSEDETPAKVADSGKKRPKPDAKTPEAKKAKLITPQKTDGKKGGHTATPHPSKKGGKTPNGGDKSTPKSGGQASSGPSKKNFNSGNARQSHTKAKHSGKK